MEMKRRIQEHPILGKTEKGKKVTFTYNGTPMEGYEGEPIAAGRCTDCVMVVDGKPNIRTCVTPLQEGMRVQTQYGVSAKSQE